MSRRTRLTDHENRFTRSSAFLDVEARPEVLAKLANPSAPLQMLCWRVTDWSVPESVRQWMHSHGLLAEDPLPASELDRVHAKSLAEAAARVFAPFWLRRAGFDELALSIDAAATLLQAGAAADAAERFLRRDTIEPRFQERDARLTGWAHRVCASAAAAVETTAYVPLPESGVYRTPTVRPIRRGMPPELRDVGKNLAYCFRDYRADPESRAYPEWMWPLLTATIERGLSGTEDLAPVRRHLPDASTLP